MSSWSLVDKQNETSPWQWSRAALQFLWYCRCRFQPLSWQEGTRDIVIHGRRLHLTTQKKHITMISSEPSDYRKTRKGSQWGRKSLHQKGKKRRVRPDHSMYSMVYKGGGELCSLLLIKPLNLYHDKHNLRQASRNKLDASHGFFSCGKRVCDVIIRCSQDAWFRAASWTISDTCCIEEVCWCNTAIIPPTPHSPNPFHHSFLCPSGIWIWCACEKNLHYWRRVLGPTTVKVKTQNFWLFISEILVF